MLVLQLCTATSSFLLAALDIWTFCVNRFIQELFFCYLRKCFQGLSIWLCIWLHFFLLLKLHCMSVLVSHFICPWSWCIFWSFPFWDCYEQCPMYCFCVDLCFHFWRLEQAAVIVVQLPRGSRRVFQVSSGVREIWLFAWLTSPLLKALRARECVAAAN